MKFSLRNILIANAFMATSLGLLLSDADVKLKRQAVELEHQKQLIERSKSFHLPLTKEEIERNVPKYKFAFDEVAKR